MDRIFTIEKSHQHPICEGMPSKALVLAPRLTERQFEMHLHNNVDFRNFPDMPPEARKEEYDYKRCDKLPPISEDMMAHLSHNPDEANEYGITCLRASKMRMEKLTVSSQEVISTGWGLHFVESWAMIQIWILILCIFGTGSLIFGICWAVLKHDVEGAFEVAAWMTTLIGIACGILQAFYD